MTALQRLIVLTLLAFASQISLADTFYKWVDEEGVTHYSATPPAEQKNTEEVKTYRNRSSQTAAPSTPAIAQPKEAAPAQDKKQFEQDLAKAKAERQSQCQQARDYKIELESKHRIRLRKDDGSIVQLSQEEKQAELDKADRAIADYCG